MAERKKELPLLSEAIGDYLDFLGAVPLEIGEMTAIKADFLRQMDFGLAGNPESLKMIPTQLGEIDKEALQEGEKALVIDAGGTGLKIAVYEVKEGELVEKEEVREMPFPKSHWQADEFFDFIAKQIKEQRIDIKGINGIGFIFSFPADAERTGKGVDVRVKADKLTKDWQIDGLKDGGLVGKQLIKTFKEKFTDDEIDFNSLSMLVMNDTVATLYGEEGAMIGGVIGTGFNLAVMIDGMIRNIEAGGFYSDVLPITQLANLFDQTTENYGQQLGEKQISGLGIGGQFRAFIKKAVEDGYLSSVLKRNLTDFDAVNVSQILKGDWDKTEEAFECSIQPGERNVLFQVSERLVDRSTHILASFIAALGEKVDQDFLKIPIEGTFFCETPFYKERLLRQLIVIDQERQYEFVGEEKRLGLIGAGRACLSFEIK